MSSKSAWISRQHMMEKNFEAYHYFDNYFKEVKLHHHDFYELYYFINGDVNYTIEGRAYSLQSGDILLISPNELHQLTTTKQNPYERIVLWMSKRYLDNISTKNTDLSIAFSKVNLNHTNLIRLPQADSNKVLKSLIQITSNYNSNEYGADILCYVRLQQILLHLNNHIINNERIKLNVEDPTIVSIINYIEKHLCEELDLNYIAKNNHISISRLSHLFKEQTGTSPYKYIIKKRLIASKQMIENNVPIVEVFEKCGFKEYSGFFRTFKKEYGITPKDFYKSKQDY